MSEEEQKTGIGTTDPQFTIQACQEGKEILRVTPDGQMTPAEGMTLGEAIQCMVKMIEHEAIERCAKIAESGSFLHDAAPDAQFGKACAAAIRRSKIGGSTDG